MDRQQKSNITNIKKITWKETRDQVKAVNPTLAHIIDQLNPGAEYSLYKAHYPYGYQMVRNGVLYLPNSSGQNVPLTDSSINDTIRNDISYNSFSNPASLILKNSLEIFIEIDNHTITYGLIPEGTIFSTWIALSNVKSHHPTFLWNINSGARSTFMLTKISRAEKYAQINKALNVKIDPPKTLAQHVDVFTALSESPEFGENWNTEVLYFGKKWFENLDDSAWKDFKLYLLQKAWDRSEFWRNEFIWDLLFSLIQKQRNLRPNPYIADTVRHLLAMSVGAYPGFAPAVDDSAAPITKIKKIFTEIYQMNEYPPTIMQPTRFDVTNAKQQPVYYSLEYPTTVSFSPRSRKLSNKITDLEDIRYLLQEKYLPLLSSGELNLNDTPLAKVPKEVSFDFFHKHPDPYDKIRNSYEVFNEDDHLKITTKSTTKEDFPVNSPFLCGCIRLSKNV